METARQPYLATPVLGGDMIHESAPSGMHHSSYERLLVVEEHPLIAAGLRHALVARGWNADCTTGPSAADVIHRARRSRPRFVLLDTQLGHRLGSGIDLIAPIVATGATAVMLTAERRRAVLGECLEAGAVGWIHKSTSLDDLDWNLNRLLSGGALIGETIRESHLDVMKREREEARRVQSIFDQLTKQELLVLAELSDGLSAKEIADAHFVSITTIRSQIRAVLLKLGVQSQLAAVALADRHRELLPDCDDTRRERRKAYLRGAGSVNRESAGVAHRAHPQLAAAAASG